MHSRYKHTSKQIILLLVMTISVLLAGVSGARAEQTIRIGAFNFYPTLFQAQDGSVKGFYVDFLNEIARREGWNIEYVYGTWADGLNRIQSGDVDLLTNVAYTEERAKSMDYGKTPLLTVWAELYVPDASEINSIMDVRGKKIAIMKGDFNGAGFRDRTEKFNIPCEYVEFGSFEEVFKAVATGKVHGGVVNNTFGAAKQTEYNVKSSGVVFNPFDIFITAAKGKHSDILATLDRYLADWRKTEGSPYHQARERWSHGTASTIRVTHPWVKKAMVIAVTGLCFAIAFIVLLRMQVRRKTAEILKQQAERKKIEETLIFINESGAKLRGEVLLNAITSYLCSTLAVNYAFVCQLLPGNTRVRTHGLCEDGAKVDDIEYDLRGTPCENVVGQTLCIYPRAVVNAFPADHLLVEMGAEAYAATPMWDSQGEAIGLLAVISKNPLANSHFVETIIQLVATRAAQELEAMNRLDELEMKSFTFENINDAAYWIAADGRLWDVNSTACKMLGYSKQELLSMTVTDLDQLSAGKWPEQWQAIKEQGSRRFETIHSSKDGLDIPVEITATYFTYSDQEYQCAIVRDMTEHKKIDEEILRAKQDWEMTFDAVPDLISIIDTNHTIIRVNRAMADRCGFSPEALTGRKCHEIMHGTSAPIAACPHVKMLQDGCAHVEQTEEKRLNGVFEISVSPIRDTHGTITACVHIARDVTARRRAEMYRSMGQDILLLLNEEGNQKDALQEIIGLVKTTSGVDAVGIRLQDEDDFPYVYQEGFPQEFLLKENSILARNQDGGICRNDNGEICLECTCGMVISGNIDPANSSYTAGGSYWSNDTSCRAALPLGENIRLNPHNECIHQGFASVALIPIRAKGVVVGLIQLNDHSKNRFTLQDIEALEDIAENIGEALLRKQAEEKMVANERFLRILTDQLPGMVGYWTDELRCTFANKSYLEWFGKTPEQMIGITIQELMGEELFARNEQYIRNALQGIIQRFERTLVKPNGETGYTWAHYIPDMVDGRVRGFFVLVSDVTELKRAEMEKEKLEGQLQQAQKMESVGRLAGGVAHDFNNLLTVISGYAELGIITTEPEHPLRPNLEEIRKAADRSAGLTSQLLAFARKQTIAPKELDLNEVIENMLKMLRRLIGEDIDLVWQPASNLWQIKADTSQIDQVLANLCVNARDAISDVGKVTIETENCSFNEEYCTDHFGFLPGEYVLLAVSDDGCGMDKETQAHIFEPFFTTKGIGEGTGLGLATVYGIVKQNNGFINIYSEPGEGTTFKIYLPRNEGKGERAHTRDAATPLSRGQETILLVEDDSGILKLTTLFLKRQGYTVLASGSPVEAIELAKVHPDRINLLMTDVVMPGMNGRDLSNELKKLRPEIKCLFSSGYTANVIAHHGVLDPNVNFISKPFSLPDLAAKVREVLDTW